MATYTTVVSLMQDLEQLMRSRGRVFGSELFCLNFTKKDVRSLYRNVSLLHSLLSDSSLESYHRRLMEQIEEKRIRSAAEEASFLLDFWAVQCLPNSSFGKSKRSLLDWSTPSSIRKVTEEIGFINEELKRILYDNNFQDLENMCRRVESFASIKASRSFSDAHAKVFGLESDVVALLDTLTGSSPQLKLCSIVGMAGIGKTTLANLLYNDPLVKHHFYVRAWITVSQRYHVKEMLLNVLVGVMPNHSDEICLKSDEELRELAYRSLKGKRYLIVLDDIWDTKAWDDLRRIFPDDKNGSRIILTSRLRNVAVHVSPDTSPHLLHCLSEDDSWELLCSKIFGNKPCPCDLVAIGKQIARKCRGLPLAIVVIGGLLSKMKDKLEVWDNVAQRLSAIAMEDAENCQNILALGYYHLPDYLKPCFLYLGIFPEDYEIPVKKLIWLWIAEGFIPPRKLKSLEQVAVEYLENLIARNLVLVKTKSSDGKNKICYIHDLMRDLCIGESRERDFFHVIESYEQNLKQGFHNLRRLSFHSSFYKYIGTLSFPYTKSMMCFETLYLSGRQLRLDMNLKLLKVLYLMNIRLQTVPEEIRPLTRLKMVAISVQNPVSLAQFSSIFHSIQTFILDSEWDIHLTSSFWNMQELRHFQLTRSCLSYHPTSSASDSPSTEKTLRVLNNLQSLYTMCPISCIKKVFLCMPNLKKLGVYETEEDHRFRGWLKKLVYLQELEKFKYTFSNPFISPNLKPGPLPYNFPPKLVKLTLSGTSYPWEDMLKLSKLPNLEVLKLRNYAFSGSIWRCNEYGFHKLGFLMIGCTDLETWECEGRDHFPKLKHIVLRHCRFLKEIPSGTFGELPLLESITVHYCNDLAVRSVIDIQEERVSLGIEGLKLFITER